MISQQQTLKMESNDPHITQRQDPDPANAFPEPISGNAINTSVGLGELLLELYGNWEAAEEDTARDVVNKTVQTEDNEPKRNGDELIDEEDARQHHPTFPGPAQRVCYSFGHVQRACPKKSDF